MLCSCSSGTPNAETRTDVYNCMAKIDKIVG